MLMGKKANVHLGPERGSIRSGELKVNENSSSYAAPIRASGF